MTGKAKSKAKAKAKAAELNDEDFGALLIEQARARMNARETAIAEKITAAVLMTLMRISQEDERPREPADVVLVGLMEALSICVRQLGIGRAPEGTRLN